MFTVLSSFPFKPCFLTASATMLSIDARNDWLELHEMTNWKESEHERLVEAILNEQVIRAEMVIKALTTSPHFHLIGGLVQ